MPKRPLQQSRHVRDELEFRRYAFHVRGGPGDAVVISVATPPRRRTEIRQQRHLDFEVVIDQGVARVCWRGVALPLRV
jgi:hypothetical protein